MANSTPSGAVKHRESTEPESGQTVKMFFFLLSSSDGLAQHCVNLSRWLTHETAFYTEQCTTPSLFHNFEESQLCQNCHSCQFANKRAERGYYDQSDIVLCVK